MQVYSDFYYYKSGVYELTPAGEYEGGHLVVLVGYETEIEPPEKKYPFSGFGGIGLRLKLSSSTAVLFSGRYLYIALEESQTMYVVIAGFVFSF